MKKKRSSEKNAVKTNPRLYYQQTTKGNRRVGKEEAPSPGMPLKATLYKRHRAEDVVSKLYRPWEREKPVSKTDGVVPDRGQDLFRS